MKTQVRTDRARYLFKVSELSGGECWISTEPIRNEIPAFKSALLGFDLPAGTDFRKAQEIAAFLNDHIESVNLTLFDDHPLYTPR